MGTFNTRQRRLFQTSFLGLIFLVGVSAAAIWSWRHYINSNRPETVADLIHLLGSGRLEERREAARRLVMAPTSASESVTAALLLSLDDPNADVRAGAVTSLGAYLATALSNRGQALLNSERGVASLDRVGRELLDSLAEDDDANVRVLAASALGLIRNKLDAISGSETRSSRPASLAHGTLVAALDAALQRDTANRRPLMLSLGLVGHRSLAAPPGLLAVLDHPDAASSDKSGSGGIIAHALSEIAVGAPEPRRTDPEAITALRDALGSGNRSTSFSAIYSLRKFGSRAAPAIPALRALVSKAIDDPDHPPVELRRAVDFALENIEGEHPLKKINP